jgi:hypothetical protein
MEDKENIIEKAYLKWCPKCNGTVNHQKGKCLTCGLTTIEQLVDHFTATMKYTRIDIKSADDLPKEEGKYFVYKTKNIETVFHEEDIWNFNPNDNENTSAWFSLIDWYLIEDTAKSYPEEFVRYCIEYVDIDDRNDLGYKYSILNDNGGDYKIFPDMDKVYEFWLNEIKNK